MSFRSHINSIVAKSCSTLGFICRITKDFNQPNTIRSLYCSLVRSNLEYASIIWNPSSNVYIKRIEKVQKRFILHYLHKIKWPFPDNVSWWQKLQQLPEYSERCKIANLDTLFIRRNVQAVLFLADILNGAIDAPAILEKLNIHVPLRQSRVMNFIYLPTLKANYLYNAPIPHILRLFNQYYQHFDFNLNNIQVKKCIFLYNNS